MTLGPRAIEVAEVNGGSQPRVLRQGRFDLPEGLSWDKPQALGEQLAAWLRQHRFGSRQVVVGLPAKWTLLKAHSLPPGNAAATTGMLRLAVEREYQGIARDWSFDYVVQPGSGATQAVLMAAAPRARLTAITQALKAAGLTTLAAMPAIVTQALAIAPDAQDAALYVAPDGVDVAIWHKGRLVAAERLVAGAQDAALRGEVARLLATHGLSSPRLIVHEAGDAPGSQEVWRERLGQSAVVLAADALPWAAQVAVTWRSQPTRTLDFLHARMDMPTGRRLTRLHWLGGLAALALLVLVCSMGVDWYLQWRTVTELERELASIRPRLATAQANVDRLRHARQWYDARPPLLDALRALTLTFPESGQVWTTNLSIRDDLTGMLTGKGQDERAAMELVEKLRSTPQFADVKLLYLTQADRTSRTVTFAMTFAYTGRE